MAKKTTEEIGKALTIVGINLAVALSFIGFGISMALSDITPVELIGRILMIFGAWHLLWIAFYWIRFKRDDFYDGWFEGKKNVSFIKKSLIIGTLYLTTTLLVYFFSAQINRDISLMKKHAEISTGVDI